MVRLFVLLLTMTFAVTNVKTAPTIADTLKSSLQELLELGLLSNTTESCMLHECDEELNLKHLHMIRSHMNSEIDPCDDFHQYACGNWHKKHPNYNHSTAEAHYRITSAFVDIFERWRQDDGHEGETEVQKKILKYYKSCLPLRPGKLPLKSFLDHMRHHWNLWNEANFNWLSTLADLGRFGYKGHFLRFEIYRLSTYKKLMLLPHDAFSNMTWDEEIYEATKDYTEKNKEALEDELREFEESLNALLNTEDSNEAATDDEYVTEDVTEKMTEDSESETENDDFTMSELEAGRGNITFESADSSKMSAAPVELPPEKWSGKVVIRLYLEKLLGRPIEPKDNFDVINLKAINKVFLFLQKSNSRTVMLYSMVRFLDYLRETSEFHDSNGNVAENVSHMCINQMRQILPLLMGYLYEMEYYEETRVQTSAILERFFNSLRAEFKSILQENAMRFGDQELEFLTEKLDHMRLNIGGLPENATPSDYSEYLSDLEVSDSDFIHNHLNALRHYTSKHLALVRVQNFSRPLDGFFLQNTLNLNEKIHCSAEYGITSNVVTVTHCYLQLPFYSEAFWDTLLYGDLATSLCHEIVHGFAVNSLEYDAVGELSPLYSAILSNAYFNSSVDCLQNGTEFLDEHIADVSGTHVALRTFRKQISEEHRNERLFFLQFAQIFCASPDFKYDKKKQSHDNQNARVNYVLAQMPEFAESFSCPIGSSMHPMDRCHLW